MIKPDHASFLWVERSDSLLFLIHEKFDANLPCHTYSLPFGRWTRWHFFI